MAPLQGVVSMEGGAVAPAHVPVNHSCWFFVILISSSSLICCGSLTSLLDLLYSAAGVHSAPTKTLCYTLPHC